MYTDAQGNEVPCADPQAGLYIRNRLGEMVRIVIPPDQIAYQLGEVFQILSGGILQATPHCVVAPRPHPQEENPQQQENRQQQQVYRNTFALFMQPRWDEILQCPDGFDPGQVGIDVWKDGMSFGEFSKRRFADYY
jgi:isopenicillin N synthase-like dioxygenase